MRSPLPRSRNPCTLFRLEFVLSLSIMKVPGCFSYYQLSQGSHTSALPSPSLFIFVIFVRVHISGRKANVTCIWKRIGIFPFRNFVPWYRPVFPVILDFRYICCLPFCHAAMRNMLILVLCRY